MSTNNFYSSIIISLQTILLYSISIIVIDYFYIFKPCQASTIISDNIRTLIFFIVFTFILIINLIFKSSYKNIKVLILFLTISAAFVFFHQQLHLKFIKKTHEVKICSLSSSKGIQGQEIIIYGQNFSPEWQPGQVLVNDFPMLVTNWSENKITVQQPVPNSYFKGQLYIINHDGTKSNSQPYEIMNPNELNTIDKYKIRLNNFKKK